MQTRPRLVTNIPFWVLVAGSLAAVIGGLVIVLRGIDALEQLVSDPNATVVTVYVTQGWISVGAAVLGAGVIGILAALAVATVVTMAPRPDVAIETIDWTSDDESAPEQELGFGSRSSTPAATPAATAAPIAVEDADVETPSTAPAPPQAAAAAQQNEGTDPASR